MVRGNRGARPALSAGNFQAIGGLAQLVERCLCKAEVRGSSPLASTNFALGGPQVGRCPDGISQGTHCAKGAWSSR